MCFRVVMGVTFIVINSVSNWLALTVNRFQGGAASADNLHVRHHHFQNIGPVRPQVRLNMPHPFEHF